MAGRRSNGEGAIARRKDGLWEARFTYADPETGEQKRASSYGKTQAEARRKMREKRTRVDAGQPVRDATVPLSEWVDRWVATTLAASDRKQTTKATYATLAKVHIANGPLGTLTLDRVKPSDIDALTMHLRAKGKASSTVRQVYTILRALLDAAVRDGLLARNPALSVARPGVERKEARSLSPAEVLALLDATKGSRFAPLVAFLARTGLRRGEALALHWSDVDDAGGVIRVRGTLSRDDRRSAGDKLVITEPKTERSRRAVALSKPVRAILARQRELQAADRAALPDLWQDSGLVFTSEVGGPVDPRNALRAVSVAAEKAGLAGVTVHTLRHSAASGMLNAGVPLTAVSDVLGHSSIAITGDVYGHVAPEVQRAAMDALDAALDSVRQ